MKAHPVFIFIIQSSYVSENLSSRIGFYRVEGIFVPSGIKFTKHPNSKGDSAKTKYAVYLRTHFAIKILYQLPIYAPMKQIINIMKLNGCSINIRSRGWFSRNLQNNLSVKKKTVIEIHNSHTLTFTVIHQLLNKIITSSSCSERGHRLWYYTPHTLISPFQHSCYTIDKHIALMFSNIKSDPIINQWKFV